MAKKTGAEAAARQVRTGTSDKERLLAVAHEQQDAGGHSEAVAHYSRLLAQSMDVQEAAFLRDLEKGAILHDIGKVFIPEVILRKHTSLTRIEQEIVRQHPLWGFRLISGLEALRGAALVVLYHHERYDGRGYPFGLAREEIPLAARIFSLADALDAMTSDRPYRRGFSFERARAEIIRCRRSQFDPEVVEAFLRLPPDRWVFPDAGLWPVPGSSWIH